MHSEPIPKSDPIYDQFIKELKSQGKHPKEGWLNNMQIYDDTATFDGQQYDRRDGRFVPTLHIPPNGFDD